MRTLLSENMLFPAYRLNSFDLIQKASAGIEAEVFFQTSEMTGISKENLAELLDTSVKTLQRQRKEKNRLNIVRSEHLLKLMALYEQGREVFGSTALFSQWLAQPAFGLGGYVPAQLLKTFSGMDLIGEELNRIAHGDIA
jgi:putative toxin-antitoxin system antitoxin component (TIGR02293 family)